MLGLSQPTTGKIFIDDRELKEYALTSFRKAISVIDSQIYLVDRSIEENLTYGLTNISHERVIRATKLVNAYEFIVNLPQNFVTLINDKEVLFSAEQKLKLAIARAWLRNPQIVVVNEQTEILKTFKYKSIADLFGDRTIIILTDRVVDLENVHQIIVVHKNKVLEVGTHAKLIKNNRLYANLYSREIKNSLVSPPVETLAQKIAAKLLQQDNMQLSSELREHFQILLNNLKLITDYSEEDIAIEV